MKHRILCTNRFYYFKVCRNLFNYGTENRHFWAELKSRKIYLQFRSQRLSVEQYIYVKHQGDKKTFKTHQTDRTKTKLVET